MPVEKYRSVEEMNAARIRVNAGDAFRRFVRHCARFRRMSRTHRPRGVFRFRSIEEAQSARQSDESDLPGPSA